MTGFEKTEDAKGTRDAIHELLLRESTLTLGTVGADLRPHSTPLFYLPQQDLSLIWFSSSRSLHSRNCVARPSVAIAIHAATFDWRSIRGVQLHGTVARVSARRERALMVGQFCERFKLRGPPRLAMCAMTLYRFKPRWARLIENAKAFGTRTEIWLTDE